MGGLLSPVFLTYGRENGVTMTEAAEQGVRRGRKFDQVLAGDLEEIVQALRAR